MKILWAGSILTYKHPIAATRYYVGVVCSCGSAAIVALVGHGSPKQIQKLYWMDDDNLDSCMGNAAMGLGMLQLQFYDEPKSIFLD